MISSLPGDKCYDDFSNSPCDMIVPPATYHDDRVLFWDPTCTRSIMFQFKRVSICEEILYACLSLPLKTSPGTISAVSFVASLEPPSSMMELGGDSGVQAV